MIIYYYRELYYNSKILGNNIHQHILNVGVIIVYNMKVYTVLNRSQIVAKVFDDEKKYVENSKNVFKFEFNVKMKHQLT